MDDWFDTDVMLACESPIEHRMAGGMAALAVTGEANIRFVMGVARADELTNIRDAARYPDLWLHVFPQEIVGRYRADFLVVASLDGRCKTLIVECDGKEFHQDKAKDAERDEYMEKLGYRVMRFPGSDIWSDARKCARRVVDCADLVLRAIEPKPGPSQQPLHPEMKQIFEHLAGVLPVTYWGWIGDQLRGRKPEENGDA